MNKENLMAKRKTKLYRKLEIEFSSRLSVSWGHYDQFGPKRSNFSFFPFFYSFLSFASSFGAVSYETTWYLVSYQVTTGSVILNVNFLCSCQLRLPQ